MFECGIRASGITGLVLGGGECFDGGMKLEEQVVSLELALVLKELGVRQDAVFSWRTDRVGDSPATLIQHVASGFPELVSAFSVAELGLMFPALIEERTLLKTTSRSFKVYFHFLDDNDEPDLNIRVAAIDLGDVHIKDNNEADLRGRALVWLIENKLLSPASA